MKYPDEKVQTSAVQLAKRRQYTNDIDALISDYERLRKKEKALSEKSADLARDLAAMRRARDTYKSGRDDLLRENLSLKNTLRAVRGSSTMRLGRILTTPAVIVRKFPAQLRKSLKSSVVSGARPLAISTGKVQEKARVTAKAPDSPSAAGSIPLTLVDLEKEFAERPSKGSLYRLISHEYFTLGRIEIPAQRMALHSELLKPLSDQESRVLQNIAGQASLLNSPPFISPRQSNYGYIPERDRVMYCAHSTGKFNSNGYSTRTAGLVAGIKASGDDVFVVARPGYPWDVKTDEAPPGARRFETSIAGVRHVFNPGPSWSKDRLDHYLAQSVDIYVREAQRRRVGVIHSASNYVTALPALMAARRLGVPFVYEVRGLWEVTELSNRPDWAQSDRFRLSARMEALVAKEADAVLAITSQVADELVRRGVDRAKIDLLPNSVDTDVFTAMPPVAGLRQRLKIDEKAVVVGYSGSLVAYEGLEDLLAAIRIMQVNGTNVHLVVVGDGKQLSELKSLATELSISNIVSFVGRVAAASVPDYVSIFDIMPCPRRSLPVTEMVSPLKPLEAMASGKAVVLTDLAPLRDLAGDNEERALICTDGDPQSLADAMTRLVQDVDLRSSTGRRARLWTVDCRTWKRTGLTATRSHERVRSQQKNGSSLGHRTAHQLRIGLISDQFTMESLAPESDFVALHPDLWRKQLEEQPIDVLLVESAWEGKEGTWRRKVGFYGDEEFASLRSLLAYCNANSVPTVFWNKEDPVHFNRFRVTAKYFDHVFTTDAECIKKYWENAGSRLKTVASLPFYAQPVLHNILPSQRPYEHSVSYAGSYYGEKYPKRSAELAGLLNVSKGYGLTIYDRQHLNPESPYHFPPTLAPFVRGGLEYSEMVEAYKAHPVHLNVNSVSKSPTMFSRRVMELAGSGAAVMSGSGRGVEEVLDGLVPVVTGTEDAGLLLGEWMGNERVRARDAWLSYRSVHRSHTAAHRVAYVLRTAGFQLIAPELPAYGVYIEDLNQNDILALERQTHLPSAVFTSVVSVAINSNKIPIIPVTNSAAAFVACRQKDLKYLGRWAPGIDDRTVFEDLLSATTFGSWATLGFSEKNLNLRGLGLSQLEPPERELPSLQATSVGRTTRELAMRRNLLRTPEQPPNEESLELSSTILVAGHDLKFAQGIIQRFQAAGHTVLTDVWLDHNKHDVAKSTALLEQATVIFCEWGLGNAVWYSENKRPHQRLVVRVHSQEIFRPYLQNIRFSAVEKFIFVGQHIANIATRDHSVPPHKSVVIPNQVKTEVLDRPKQSGSEFNLGLVGIVPAQKGLDKALDLLKQLRTADSRYMLFVKGKRPEDFAWMANRPKEMAYYEEQYERISSDPALVGAVTFDPHGNDMDEWYAKIGIVLSTSEFESFHMTLADGAASGAVPVSLAWPGSDQIYPTSWLHADVASMASRIEIITADSSARTLFLQENKEFVRSAFRDNFPAFEVCVFGEHQTDVASTIDVRS